MKIFCIFISILSSITLIGMAIVLLYPTAHENWYAVTTSSLAQVPLEKMTQLDKEVVAKIAIDVSEYNSNYINGATARISELKYSLWASMTVLLMSTVLLGFNVFGKKHNKLLK